MTQIAEGPEFNPQYPPKATIITILKLYNLVDTWLNFSEYNETVIINKDILVIILTLIFIGHLTIKRVRQKNSQINQN
jgi:hypothetical protein